MCIRDSDYLVEHSAGSGKSNTIAWLAHRLSSLHNDADKKAVSYTHLRAHETVLDLVCRLLLDKKTLEQHNYILALAQQTITIRLTHTSQ